MKVGRCVVVSVGPVVAGALPVVLKAPDGSVFGVDVLKHDRFSPGVSRAGSLAVYLNNGGTGRTSSVEAYGLAAMALAKMARAPRVPRARRTVSAHAPRASPAVGCPAELRAEEASEVGSRAAARVLLECNNRCVFCSQAGLQGGARVESQREAVRRRRGQVVTIVGGEPTLDPRLVERVAAARQMGFTRVGLQTNGRRLAEPGLAAQLAGAGLTDVHLSIHGAESAVHDYHTGVPGSFAEVLGALTAARANGLTVVMATVLTSFGASGRWPACQSSSRSAVSRRGSCRSRWRQGGYPRSSTG